MILSLIFDQAQSHSAFCEIHLCRFMYVVNGIDFFEPGGLFLNGKPQVISLRTKYILHRIISFLKVNVLRAYIIELLSCCWEVGETLFEDHVRLLFSIDLT